MTTVVDGTIAQISVSAAGPLRFVAPNILTELSHLDLAGRVTFSETTVVSGGAYGDVSIAVCDHPDRGRVKVAIKRLRFFLSDDIKLLFEREIYVWSILNHRNILPLLGFAFDQTTGYPLLVSEWMERGSAWSFVQANPNCDVLRLIIGVAKGLAYLHGRNIVHSDIKSDNILVSDTGDALLCDFGCSRIIDASRTLANVSTGVKGTPHYIAYELLAHSDIYTKHTTKTDVWAFGMTIYEIITRQRPYASLNPMQVVGAIIQRRKPVLPSTFSSVHDRYRINLPGICDLCWSCEPTARPSIRDILDLLQMNERPTAITAEDLKKLMQDRQAEMVKPKGIEYASNALYLTCPEAVPWSISSPRKAISDPVERLPHQKGFKLIY